MTSKPMTLGPSKSCMILPQPKSTLFWRYAAEDPQITRAVLPRWRRAWASSRRSGESTINPIRSYARVTTLRRRTAQRLCIWAGLSMPTSSAADGCKSLRTMASSTSRPIGWFIYYHI